MSDWTSSEAKEFLDIIRSEAEKVIKDFATKQSLVYSCMAVVTNVAESGAVTVRLLSSPSDGSQDFVVRNRSGSILSVNDSVWLHYWSDYTNIYVAVRNMGDVIDDVTVTASSIGALSYGEGQSLTVEQKTRVLANAGAAPATHVSQHAIGGTDALNALPYDAISSNLLINGGFLIWQRGTSFTTTGYTADRWKLTLGSGMAITATQQTFTIGQTDVPGDPTYYLQLAISNAGSADGYLEQRIEDVRTAANMSLAYSFYAKCTATTYAAKVMVVQSFGSGGSSDVASSDQNITLSTSWQKFTGTFSVASISGKTIGVGNYLSLRIVIPTASGIKTIAIANAQFNYGGVAFPFSKRHYADELALCQRYAVIAQSTDDMQCRMTFYQTGYIKFFVPLPVSMRVTPSLVGTADSNYQVYNTSGAAQTGFTFAVEPALIGVLVKATKTSHGLTDGMLRIYGSFGGFDAEL